MDYLFSFLNNKFALNPTSAGYFLKVIIAILNKRGAEVNNFVILVFELCIDEQLDYSKFDTTLRN